MIETKVCFKCKRELPLSEFYKHPQMGDGHLNKCKECTKKDVREKYTENSANDAYMEKERARGREKYHRLGYKRTERGKEKRRRFHSFGDARRYFVINEGRDVELHHWNYNMAKSVFKLEKRLHHRLHSAISFSMDEGIYYYGDIRLDSIEKHWEVINTVCDEYGFDKTKVELLTR